MSEFWTLLNREYLVRVRRRQFLLSTLLTPMLWIAPFLLPLLFINIGASQRSVTVLDQGGDAELFPIIKRNLANNPGTGTRFNLIHKVVSPDEDIDEARTDLSTNARPHSDQAYLLLRNNIWEGQPPQYYASNVTDLSLSVFGNAVTRAVTQRRLAHDGLDQAKIDSYSRQLTMTPIKVGPGGETSEEGQSFLLAILVILSIYMTISGYSAIVMHGVMEEKQSRIIEVLATSAEPHQIMASKLLGVGLVGLTQYAIWASLLFPIKVVGSWVLSQSRVPIPKINLSLVIYCAIFFLLGFFLIATLYLIIGAMASKPEDTETLRRPLLVLNMLPLFTFWIILQNPESNLSVVLSMVPFFAPTLMMMRISLAAAPAWQIIICILIMIAAIAGSLAVASRVYRMGLLLYGKKLSITEVGRWLRYS